MDISRKQLQSLADFWSVFANPKFVYETQDDMKDKKGVITMPSSSLSPEAKAFNRMMYQEGWILDGFDWPEWAQTDESKNLVSKPEALAKASADQLAMLLTALARKERFCEGTMASACSDGLLAGITQRAGMLL